MKKGRKKRKSWKVRTNDIQAVPWPLHTSVHMHIYTKKIGKQSLPLNYPVIPFLEIFRKWGKILKQVFANIHCNMNTAQRWRCPHTHEQMSGHFKVIHKYL